MNSCQTRAHDLVRQPPIGRGIGCASSLKVPVSTSPAVLVGIHSELWTRTVLMEPHSQRRAAISRLPQALLLLLGTTVLAEPEPSQTAPSLSLTDLPSSILLTAIKTTSLLPFHRLQAFFQKSTSYPLTFVGMVELAALCGLIPALWCYSRRARQKKGIRTPNGSISDGSDANSVGKESLRFA